MPKYGHAVDGEGLQDVTHFGAIGRCQARTSQLIHGMSVTTLKRGQPVKVKIQIHISVPQDRRLPSRARYGGVVRILEGMGPPGGEYSAIGDRGRATTGRVVR